MRTQRLLFTSIAAVSLVSCSQIAVVSEKRPAPLPRSSGANEAVVETLDTALTERQKQPLVALGGFVNAAHTSLRELDRNPANAEALRTYNYAIARIFTVVHEAKLDPWTHPLRVGANGEFTLTWKRDPRPQWNIALYDLVPADNLDISGTYVNNRVTKQGIGAPLIAKRVLTAQEASDLYCPPYIFYSVTGTAQFHGASCVISINDPLAGETVSVGSHTYPLAADFTASYAMLLAKEKPQKLGLRRLLRPQEYSSTFRVARLEPYDPNKTVLLVIHGLMDTPVTWVPMLNELRADPYIRRNYQFWFYSYPSGYPYPYSALVLREELDGIEKTFHLRKKMVLIGHSMGGCIGRTLITDAGTKLWMEAFGTPPAQTSIPLNSKRLLEKALIFQHRPEIGRVIFMSTPHRGSDLAINWIGRLGAALVRTPKAMHAIAAAIRQDLSPDPAALQLNRFPNSIDTLAPNNRFVVAINKLPITRTVTYYSIVGDRGRGDTPNSSDGVVAYWSSHLDGARREFIAPCNHSSPLNPQAIAEVHRILNPNITAN